MRNFKTAIIVISSVLILSVLYFFLPTEKILQRLPFISEIYNNTSLTISSKKGKAEVKINNKNYGETPVSIDNLPEGSYTVELNKISAEENFYETSSFQVELFRNTESLIEIEIAPKGLQSGYVMYYTKSPGTTKEKGHITLAASPSISNIYLDDEFFSSNPANAVELKTREYQIRVSADGYEEIRFPVIIREGYNLNIRSYLLPIPITMEQADTKETDD